MKAKKVTIKYQCTRPFKGGFFVIFLKKRMAKKYSDAAQKKVGKVMHEFKEGDLKSGSGKKVKSRKQAIAIGISEARKEGKKVPAKKSSE